MPSVFSRIVSGEIPAVTVYEDEQTLAFLDISPATAGHTLVIAKDEHADLFELPDAALLATARTVQRVAKALRAVLHPDGLNIVQNNGAAAGQTVLHYHVHLIPRWEGDGALPLWTPGTSDSVGLQELAERIKTEISH